MSRRVRLLPEPLAQQLAAGEVVERPASVVRELVENALDAGAGHVEVAVTNGGKTEIRVADDGHGMGREDALLALERHATSRLHDAAELAGVRTLGFRGEALPAVAAVSRLTLETAAREGDGTRVLVHAGRVVEVDDCARPVGTTVVVRSLFFNEAERARGLRSAATEARAVSEVVVTLALAHPEVGFSLESNGRGLLTLPPVPELRARIATIWGEPFAQQLLPVAFGDGGAALTGLVQRPHGARPGSRRTHLFVNGRAVTDRQLVRAADRGYQGRVEPAVRPSLFLFLDLPAGAVDVNVHPAKAEVRFQDAAAVERLVEEGVRLALQALDGAAEAAGPATPPSPAGARDDAAAEAEAALQQMSLFLSGPTGAPPPAAAAEPEAAPPAQPAMWQVHDSYIFAETRGGVIIVDQHAAHGRVLYEELMRGFDLRAADSQRLLFPITLRLSPAEFTVVEELSGLLAALGYEIEPFGGRAVVVHGAPSPHPYFDAERCLREVIAELTEGSPLVDAARSQHQRLALSFASRAAIRPGQRLTQAEMSELFDRLFATELPYQDIHGRPTLIQLSIAELHDRFRRSG